MRVARHNFRETVIKGEIELPYEPAQVHKVISELGATSLNDLMQRCSPNVGGMNLKICYNLAVSLESIQKSIKKRCFLGARPKTTL